MSTIKKIPYSSPDFTIQSIGKRGRLDKPFDVLVDGDDNLIISEVGNHRIHKMTTTGITISSNFIGSGLEDETPGNLSYPRGITLSSEGKLFVCDSENHQVQKFNIIDGKFESVFSVNQYIPQIIKIAPNEDRILLSAYPNEDRILLSAYPNKMIEYTMSGQLIGFINSKNENFEPSGFAFNSRGDLLIGECNQNKIELFDTRDREFITSFKISGDQDVDWFREIYLTIDSFDNIIISNTSEGKIEIFDAGFEQISVFSYDNIKTNNPFGICVDENHGRIIFCDCLNHRLRTIQYLNF